MHHQTQEPFPISLPSPWPLFEQQPPLSGLLLSEPLTSSPSKDCVCHGQLVLISCSLRALNPGNSPHPGPSLFLAFFQNCAGQSSHFLKFSDPGKTLPPVDMSVLNSFSHQIFRAPSRHRALIWELTMRHRRKHGNLGVWGGRGRHSGLKNVSPARRHWGRCHVLRELEPPGESVSPAGGLGFHMLLLIWGPCLKQPDFDVHSFEL